jgi:hypothetical protein
MQNKTKNKQGGFFELIILIVIALILLNYYHISARDAVDWFTTLLVAGIDWLGTLIFNIFH